MRSDRLYWVLVEAVTKCGNGWGNATGLVMPAHLYLGRVS